MTYYRSGLDKAFVFVCDECGDEDDTGLTDFHDAKDAYKERGFIAPAPRGTWEHTCATCKGT